MAYMRAYKTFLSTVPQICRLSLRSRFIKARSPDCLERPCIREERQILYGIELTSELPQCLVGYGLCPFERGLLSC